MKGGVFGKTSSSLVAGVGGISLASAPVTAGLTCLNITATEAPAEVEEPWAPAEEDIEILGRVLEGEASIVPSKAHQAAVAWVCLNRLDSGYRGAKTLYDVIVASKEFDGYKDVAKAPAWARALAEDVLCRWHAEKEGATDVGRTIPSSYLFFISAKDGSRENIFTESWHRNDRAYARTVAWDWSLPNPYV